MFYKPECLQRDTVQPHLYNKKQPTTVRSLSIHHSPHLLLAWTLTKMIHELILVKYWDYTESQYFKTEEPTSSAEDKQRVSFCSFIRRKAVAKWSSWGHTEVALNSADHFILPSATERTSLIYSVLFQRTKQGRSVSLLYIKSFFPSLLNNVFL